MTEEDEPYSDPLLASEAMALATYVRSRHRAGDRILGHAGKPGGECVSDCSPGCLVQRADRVAREIKQRGFCVVRSVELPAERQIMKIAFDVGGVLSKYPHVFTPLLEHLHKNPGVDVFVISDMHPPQKIIDMLELNGVSFYKHRVHSADYDTHGELCKTVLCEELGIDVLIDDFPGYVAMGRFVRLLVMPNPEEPYYHDDWKSLPGDPLFGRRRPGTRSVQAPAPEKRQDDLAQRDEVKPSDQAAPGADSGTTVA